MAGSLVSVIIPTFNYARFVTEALASALAQSYPHREIIVVDDGSTDNTRQVLQPYFDRIVYIHQQNQGLSGARNTGIQASKGEFIALLDSDDAWHPRKLEMQVSFLRAHPEVGLVATDQFTDQRSHWPAIDAGAASRNPILLSIEDIVGKARFGPSSALIRKSCLDDVGLFDPTLRCVEDRDMWIRLASRHRLAMLPCPLLWYRLHAESLSNKAGQMEKHELRVLEKAFSEIPVLRGRRLLRRKTYSQAAFAAAQLYRAEGKKYAAFRRLVASLWLWPWPLRMHGDGRIGVRPRVMINLLLRMVKLRASETRPGAEGAAAAPRAAPPSSPLATPAVQ